MKTLTHSRLASFRACPRRHWMRYELGLVPERDSFSLRVGSAFHLALDTLAKGGDPGAAMEQALDDPYDLALVAAMLQAHTERYRLEPLEPVASELAFDLPLRNPATGAASTVWRIAGVIDRIVRLGDGRAALMECKTTSLDFSPGADYWLRLHMDQQLSIYVLAAREMGYEIDTVLYDVTRRPALRPLMATPEEKRKYKASGALYANQREEDESLKAFAARVAEDMRARPDRYFARIEIARLDQDLDDCAAELWQQQKSLRAAQRAGHWYRNPGACFSPWPCAYLPVCQQRGTWSRQPRTDLSGWTAFTRNLPRRRRVRHAMPRPVGRTDSEGEPDGYASNETAAATGAETTTLRKRTRGGVARIPGDFGEDRRTAEDRALRCRRHR